MTVPATTRIAQSRQIRQYLTGEYSEYYETWLHALDLELEQIERSQTDDDEDAPINYFTVRNKGTKEEVTVHITKRETIFIHFDIDANQTTTKKQLMSLEKAREIAKTLL
ncbi:hypothetical protein ELBI_22 [Anabaena phage Elbi]|nr:hypothetical protein ELBI_22 [Anabaena phage Elbi]